MMRKYLLCSVLSLLQLFAIAQHPKKVAIYVIGDNAGINKVLESKLVYALSCSEIYIAIERTTAFLAELSKEQSYQRTGAVNDNDISRLGKQFGVQYVCVAEVSDVFGEKYISARLIDVETAEVVNSYGVGGAMNSMDDCLIIANEIATNLSKGTLADQMKLKRAEVLRMEKERKHNIELLEAQGYVDLNLPSGTLWKKNNESDRLYDYDTAECDFGDKLPTYEQWTELKNNCKWTWNGNSYTVTSNNGKSIILPAAGYSYCDDRDVMSAGAVGHYWSSTPCGPRKAWKLCFGWDGINIVNEARCFGNSVRFVQNP